MTLFRPLCVSGLTVISLCAAEPAGTDCKARILDRTSILQEEDRTRIEAASQSLINQGADVHVVTTELKNSESLDAAVKSIIASCPSWQTADGAAQDNLLVLVTAPAERKSTILFGAGWGNALDDHWNSIVTDYMARRVRNRHYAKGFIAAEQQLSRRIQEAEDRDRRTKRWFTAFLLLAASCLFIHLIRIGIRALKARQQQALANAELRYSFREWLNEELLKVTIDSLRGEDTRRRLLRQQLTIAKEQVLNNTDIAETWRRLRQVVD